MRPTQAEALTQAGEEGLVLEMDADGPDGFAHVFEKVVKVTETKHKLVFKAWSLFDDVSELLEPARQRRAGGARRGEGPPEARTTTVAAPAREIAIKMEEAAGSGLQTGEPAFRPTTRTVRRAAAANAAPRSPKFR